MFDLNNNLIIESAEFAKINRLGIADNIFVEEFSSCSVTTVDVITDMHMKKYAREKGRYITIETDKVYTISDDEFENITSVISKCIKKFTDEFFGDRIIVVGIGNRNITPDSIGPKTIDRVIVTRGLENTGLINESCFGNVSAICTDVFGVTGVESAEVIAGVAYVLKPKLIIVVDALATCSVNRLCKTIQISNTAIVPGGGVNSSREIISPQKLKVPIVSIGMPTVINSDILSVDDRKIFDKSDPLITVTSRIDDATDAGAKLIAFSLNKALHSDISTEDILKFLY